MNNESNPAQKAVYEPADAVFALQQTNKALVEVNALLNAKNKSGIIVAPHELAALHEELAAMKAKNADLEEALAVANGKHGGNWNSQPRIKGRMEQ